MDSSLTTENSFLAATQSSPSLSAAMHIPVRSQTRTGKRPPVPLILESFPTPPTYIPPSSHETSSPASHVPLPSRGPSSPLSRPLGSFSNPPPSLPPVAPLPPLPGPSPISDHESILIMSSNRSRRSSKLSIQSSSQSIYSTGSSYLSGRGSMDTTSSTASANSPPAAPCTFGTTRRRGSIGSVRSLPAYSSNASLSSECQGLSRAPDKLSTLGYAISEEESTDLSHVLSPLSDKENLGTVSSRRDSRRTQMEESISTIDVPSIHSESGPNVDSHAQNLHIRMRASRSKSESHKKDLRSRSTSPSAAGSVTSSSTISRKVPLVPQRQPTQTQTRSNSPDIADIISTTPRPRMRISSLHSNRSSRDSQSLSRSGSMRRYTSDLQGAGSRLSTLSRSASDGFASRTESPAELSYTQDESWNEESFVEDYGKPINRRDQFVAIDPAFEAQLDGNGSDSDSSLDLHTPLPHLMLRHGLLSPHSKLLPESNQLSCSRSPLPDSRPESIMSVASNASVMTKSGLFKDQRDTPQRRVRHRDGRQLRAGMGLTTGLGWSDSEDEDAPSPLTRRLSNLNLTNRSSSSSLKLSMRPLSSSQSISTLHVDTSDRDASAPQKSCPRPRPPLPPTSWQKRSASGGVSVSGRTSTSSIGSTFSLTLSIPEDDPNANGGVRRSPSGSSTRQSGLSSKFGRDAVDTPSTASTISLPMPATPDDAPVQQKLDKDKGLPPLPAPALPRYPSSLALRTPATSSSSSNDVGLRPRTTSSASSVSSADAVSVTQSTPTMAISPTTVSPTSLMMPLSSYTSRTARTPRPLRLSQSINSNIQPGELPQRSGQVLTYNRNLHDQQRMRAASGPTHPGATSDSPTALTTPIAPGFSKPMPRTGTGMVYRTSSNPGNPPLSRLRMPGTLSQSLRTSSAGGHGVPPTTAVPRSIAL